MGNGSWTTQAYCSYSTSIGRSYDHKLKTFTNDYESTAQAFVQNKIDKNMRPFKVMRECKDTDEHPNTIPVILALDVTGSMGDTAIEVQKKLNPLMIKLYEEIKDIEIMIMAIGDLSYDDDPIQISQFESDIRIAENLDKIYFENGGGGNGWESYTAPWYMGLKHCKLDCWDRGKKGLIITMGDECLNPHLPKDTLNELTGDTNESAVNTDKLYKDAIEKFNIYHICVESGCYPNQSSRAESFEEVIGKEHVMISNVENISNKIFNIIKDHANNSDSSFLDTSSGDSKILDDDSKSTDDEISW